MELFNFVKRQKELLQIFRMDKEVALEESNLEIRFVAFESEFPQKKKSPAGESLNSDSLITENSTFHYPVFIHKGSEKAKDVIVLLHGLNERNWDKYLCWAEYLANHTGKAVMLFPIAYHINRSPVKWSDPRSMSLLVSKRQLEVGQDRSLCFANVALSERLSENPERFYTSGRQTVQDLTSLVRQIKNGNHPLLAKGASVDFFAYSIGAFLSEITLMSNPERLFEKSKLFIFCGGSLFRYMFGESRSIMDKLAYKRLLNYYCTEWLGKKQKKDQMLDAFNTMIMPEMNREKREGFFTSLGNRLSGISLKKDKVMPYEGVEACMGHDAVVKQFTLTDFPFEYTHEAPFPTNAHIDESLLNTSFNDVFSKAALFLS